MQSSWPERFEREMGCTEREWLGWLPAAVGSHPWQRNGSEVLVQLAGGGSLLLRWHAGPPRVIALVRLPVLHVAFEFQGVAQAPRHVFMKRFDLYMQRGGG